MDTLADGDELRGLGISLLVMCVEVVADLDGGDGGSDLFEVQRRIGVDSLLGLGRLLGSGGLLGGISNGMPIVFRLAVKPTPSIARTQKSVSLSAMQNAELNIHGRHDPCIVPRAVPCVEAAAAIAIYDALKASGI